MPTISRPGQNVFAVLKGRGSQCAPSCDVQTGVDDPSDPTAMKPPRQRRTERTSVNGSVEANFRHWMPVHAASAGGGMGVVNAVASAGDGAGLDATGEGPLVGTGVVEGCDAGDAATPGVADAVADAVVDATGTGEVVVPQPASAMTLRTSVRCRRVLIRWPPS
jgi:hypothetical protein